MWKTVKEATKEEKLETKKGKRRREEACECKIKTQCASTELQTLVHSCEELVHSDRNLLHFPAPKKQFL